MKFLQGGKSVKECSFNFTQLSKYPPTFVACSRAVIKKFVMGVSSLVEQECRTSMLHNDMYISSLIIFFQQIEDTKFYKINKEAKRDKDVDQG